MPVHSWALDARKRLMEQAKEQQIAGAAAGGIKQASAQDVEAARLRYQESLDRALARYGDGLPGDKRGNQPLSTEEKADLTRKSHGEAEVRRLMYEEVRGRYEAQERRASDERASLQTSMTIEAADPLCQRA